MAAAGGMKLPATRLVILTGASDIATAIKIGRPGVAGMLHFDRIGVLSPHASANPS